MKCGIAAVVGRSNAGKSTLINVLVGEKVAITSPKPQTTRDRIAAVKNGDGYQIVFEDTPGFYKAAGELNRKMQRTAKKTVDGVDVALFLIDAHAGLKEEDLKLLRNVCAFGTPVIAVITKLDITVKEKVPEYLCELSKIDGVTEIVPISSRNGRNLDELIKTVLKYLPEREPIYGEDVISDKSEKFMISEIMREKILLTFEHEIPHGVAVVVNEFKKEKNGVYDINLDIICEKQNHKSILIGKQGAAIKKASTMAREEMEKFLGAKVFLTTYVLVKENWRDRENLLKEYGYSDVDGLK